jgi:putative thioredoxin
MLIGMPQTPARPTQNPAGAPADIIFDVTTADFQTKVLQASLEKPVIVDFWAPWCGPCKQLGPALESAVRAAGGAVLMAKANIDACPDLAQALRIQSVPTVYAFFQGRPVDAFTGAQPASQIKVFIDALLKLARAGAPDALDVPATLKHAAQALAQGDPATAQALYADILAQDETHVEAWVGMVRSFIAAGLTEQARGFIDAAPESVTKNPGFEAARTALALAQSRPATSVKDLEDRLARNPDDHSARFDLAMALFTGEYRAEAVEALIEIISRNRSWEDEKARKQLLGFFEAWGPADPATLAGRRRLSTALFS